MKLAIWVRGAGWLVDSSGDGETSDRLADAAWFDDEVQVSAAVEACALERDEFEVISL